MSNHAFAIPEIQLLIAQYLDRTDLVTLARVCKSSNDALTSCIWSSVTSDKVQKGNTCVPGFEQGLRRNKGHIQAIAICNDCRVDLLSLRGCDRLKTMTVHADTSLFYHDGGSASPQQTTAEANHILKVAGFIVAHSATLKEITLNWRYDILITPARELWSAIAQCSGLEKLSLAYLAVDKLALEDFLKACAIPRTLELWHMAICQWSRWPSDNDEKDLASKLDSVPVDNSATSHIGNTSHNKRFILEGPRHVTIWASTDGPSFPGLSAFGQAMMLRWCVNLEDFRWYPDRCKRDISDEGSFGVAPEWGKPKAAKFLRGLAKDPWELPHFKTFNAQKNMVDEDIAAVLRQMNQLKIFKSYGARFGRLSFQALIESGAGRLCNTVEELQLGCCPGVTSAMITTILASCPRLKELSAFKISTSDIVKGPEWVCGGLQTLHLFIEVDADTEGYQSQAMERATYERLARLTKLRYLSIDFQGNSPYLFGQNKPTLNLRLQAGMGALTNLKEMRSLSFMESHDQKMGVEEAQWIAENWPKMREICGPVNQDRLIVREMAQVLSQVEILNISSNRQL